MKIAIADTGYVGLSNAIPLPQHIEMVALEIDPAKVALLNDRCSPIADPEIEDYPAHLQLNRRFTLDYGITNEGASYVISTSADGRPQTNRLATTSAKMVVKNVMALNHCPV